ncbi:MAG: chromate transporter [Ruminococcaceae bacterium]|nr:chromate transporter [Oscillospiraceae bacterium]
MIFLRLFIEFFKTGLFSIGGGLATIPFLSAMGEKWGWFDEATLGNMIAVGESTPGPIGVNMATYVGYTVGMGEYGIWGAILGGFIATLALVLPSVIIILIIARILKAFKENKLVERSFYSIRPAVTGMIATAAVAMIKSAVFTKGGNNILKMIDLKALILFSVLLIATNVKPIKKLHPIFFILIAGAIGAIFKMGAI